MFTTYPKKWLFNFFPCCPKCMIKSWSQVICFKINILTQIHAIIYVIKYFDIQINLPLFQCRMKKEGRKRLQSKIYGCFLDDRSSLQSENKTAQKQSVKRKTTSKRTKRKNDRKRDFLKNQIYWLQVAHTGDYLLNDLKMDIALRYWNVKLSMGFCGKEFRSTYLIYCPAGDSFI